MCAKLKTTASLSVGCSMNPSPALRVQAASYPLVAIDCCQCSCVLGCVIGLPGTGAQTSVASLSLLVERIIVPPY